MKHLGLLDDVVQQLLLVHEVLRRKEGNGLAEQVIVRVVNAWQRLRGAVFCKIVFLQINLARQHKRHELDNRFLANALHPQSVEACKLPLFVQLQSSLVVLLEDRREVVPKLLDFTISVNHCSPY